jgi:hypothetical protein
MLLALKRKKYEDTRFVIALWWSDGVQCMVKICLHILYLPRRVIQV